MIQTSSPDLSSIRNYFEPKLLEIGSVKSCEVKPSHLDDCFDIVVKTVFGEAVLFVVRLDIMGDIKQRVHGLAALKFIFSNIENPGDIKDILLELKVIKNKKKLDIPVSI